MKNEVAVLIATYNGEKFLKEQVESILKQTYQNFVIYIRDDGSTDNTLNVINELEKNYSKKIIVIKDNKKCGGSCKNFLALLEYAYNLKKHDLYMFCDQDDVWIKTKIEDTVNKYYEDNPNNVPALVHTDLVVVDSKLNVIENSFFDYTNLNKNYKTFEKYLIQNNVTGCTMLINNELAALVNYKMKDILMHDWYFALLASAFGKVIFIDKPTIKYRQHGNNVLGAKRIKGIKGIYNKLVKNNTIKHDLNKTFLQAEEFKKEYYKLLSDYNKKILDEFCMIKKVNKVKRISIIIKNKFYKQSLIKLMGEFVYI